MLFEGREVRNKGSYTDNDLIMGNMEWQIMTIGSSLILVMYMTCFVLNA